jgi:hypothetical protein
MNDKSDRECRKITFEVLTVTNIKTEVFWDVTPCNLVGEYLSTKPRGVTRRS